MLAPPRSVGALENTATPNSERLREQEDSRAGGASWLHLGITTPNRAEVSLRGTTDNSFGIGEDIALPPAAVDLFEGKGFEPLDDSSNSGSGERDKVRIAAHEA